MKKSQTLREIVFFITGPEIDYDQITVDCPILNHYIKEGNSTFLISEKKNHESNPFGSFLGFPTNIEKLNFETQKYKSEELSMANTKVSDKAQSNDEEETFEIKYPTNPSKFNQLASFNMLVITNSDKNAKLCDFTDINYFYTEKQFEKSEILSLLESLNVDLLFIDLNHDTKESNIIIEKIEQLLSDYSEVAPYIRIILPLQDKNQKEVTSRHLKKNETRIDFLNNIIPNQTWQYSQGEVKFDSTIEKTISIMINHKQNRNRKDKIENIKNYSDSNHFGNFGGAVVFSSAIIREISFELEKLPKFGA